MRERARLFILGVLGVLLLTARVRADNIDKELGARVAEIRKVCQALKVKNVGTLRFRVQVGAGKPSLDVEPLCSNLAERLENLLVVGVVKEGVPGVIRAAGRSAAAQGRTSASSVEGRKRLFDLNYPLAWGKEKVKADAFLMGQVVIPASLEKAQVSIDLFHDLEPEKLVRVCAFEVAMDRSMLADAGLPFLLNRRAQKLRDPQEADRAAVASARTLAGLSPESSSVPGFDLVRLRALVGGKVVELTPEKKGLGRFTLSAIPAGRKLEFQLENLKDDKLAVLVRVAGENTVRGEIDEPHLSRKWILNPGKKLNLKGYYLGEALDREMAFHPVVKPESELAPGLAGLVEVAIFTPSEEDRRPQTLSLRGLSESERRIHSRSWSVLSSALRKRAGIKTVVSRGGDLVIAPAAEAMSPPVVEEQFTRGPFAGYFRVQIAASEVGK